MVEMSFNDVNVSLLRSDSPRTLMCSMLWSSSLTTYKNINIFMNSFKLINLNLLHIHEYMYLYTWLWHRAWFANDLRPATYKCIAYKANTELNPWTPLIYSTEYCLFANHASSDIELVSYVIFQSLYYTVNSGNPRNNNKATHLPKSYTIHF